MKKRFSHLGTKYEVTGVYDTDEAIFEISLGGKHKCSYDEYECDNLLRVVEHARDPKEDLAEFFQPEYGRYAYSVAEFYYANATEIGKLVYADVSE